jgi:tetratricopeptide (TPR) repeat protein
VSDPQIPPGTPDRVAAEAAYRRAEEFFLLRNREANERAIASYAKAIEQDPTFAPAYAGLASAYCEARIRYGQPRTMMDSAIALAEKSVALDPGLARGYDAMAGAYFAKGALHKSLEVSQRAYAADPAYTDAVASIAFLFLDLGELDQAVDWSRRALALSGQSSYARAYVYRNLGRLCFMFGQHDLAEAWLRQSLTLQPSFPSAHVLLIYLSFIRGDVTAASAEAKMMLERKPDDPEALNYGADVALLERDVSRAARLLERAISLGPDSRNFYHARRAMTGLAYVLWKQGDRTAARRVFDERIARRVEEFTDGLNAWGAPYELAAIHAVLGDRVEALAWLERSVEAGWREPHLARIDVLLEGLRDDPQYERILSNLQTRVRQFKERAAELPAHSSL